MLYTFLTAMLILENCVKAAGKWEYKRTYLNQTNHQNTASNPNRQYLLQSVSNYVFSSDSCNQLAAAESLSDNNCTHQMRLKSDAVPLKTVIYDIMTNKVGVLAEVNKILMLV